MQVTYTRLEVGLGQHPQLKIKVIMLKVVGIVYAWPCESRNVL